VRKECQDPQRDMRDHLDSLHKVDFENNVETIKQIRKLRNEILEGKNLSRNAKKAHVDPLAPKTK